MPRPLSRVLTRDEAARLLSQPNVRCRTGLRNRVMLEIMYRAGLRVGEVCRLLPQDIRWEDRKGQEKSGGWLDIRMTKRKKSRAVPIPQTLADWLARWEMARPEVGERFFCAVQDRKNSPLGSPLSENYLWQMVQREGHTAGLDRSLCHPHVLRHSYATELLRAGVSLKHIQELLGHSTIQVTADTYLHLRPEDLQTCVEGWDTLLREGPVEGRQPFTPDELRRWRALLEQMEIAQGR